MKQAIALSSSLLLLSTGSISPSSTHDEPNNPRHPGSDGPIHGRKRSALFIGEVPPSESKTNVESDRILGDSKRRLRGSRISQSAEPIRSSSIQQQLLGNRRLNTAVSSEFMILHPWYPDHLSLQCSNDGNPPSWMTWQGGYAENHLFAHGEDCCNRWFGESATCIGAVEHLQAFSAHASDSASGIVEDSFSGGTLSSQKNDAHKVSNDQAESIVAGVLSMTQDVPAGKPSPASNFAAMGNQDNFDELEIIPQSHMNGDYYYYTVNDLKETFPTYSVGEPVMVAFEERVNEPIIRADKAEILGIPVLPEKPRPVPVQVPVTVTGNDKSPYTLDKNSFGKIAVAAMSCEGGCPSASSCVGNAASGQAISDPECSPCNSGQTWWPCDVKGLCWCWKDGTDRIAPAPRSGLDVEVKDEYYTVCDDILSRGMFQKIAPDAREPYTYEGLCDAILSYNAHHTEKVFGMGSMFDRSAELAAFIGNTLHESDEYKAPREYLMCADNKIVGGEVFCKPCDPGSFDWGNFKCNHSLVSGASDFNEYCQPSSKPPEACHCGNGAGQTGDLEGYVPARTLFFGRGAIQLSWNYNYIGASVALTGSPDTFCDDPDLVAKEGRYTWGAGLYFWMEHVKELTTSHMQALSMDFGGTLNNINGGLECPAHGGWHVDAVKARLNRYCRAASALGLPNLMKLDGCAGLDEALRTCLPEGKCDECRQYEGKFNGRKVSSFVPAAAEATAAATTSTAIEIPADLEEPVCPDGLMPWEKNENCCVPNPNFLGDGACDPESPYNTAICGYDGGDCCKRTCEEDTAFGCKVKKEDDLGRYGPFGFFCVDPSQGHDTINSLLCDVEEKFRIGDGRCDSQFNVPACNHDGGDCCVTSCDEEHSFFTCGDVSSPPECLDPRHVVETPPPTSQPTPDPTTTEPTTRAPVETLSPTTIPTHKSTSLSPTPKPTSLSPTRKPTSLSPTPKPTSLSPTPKPTTSSPTEATQFQDGGSLIGRICPMDMMECSDGSFVGRNPDDECSFDPCPEIQPQTVITKCESTLMECPGIGTFVAQDSSNDCQFYPCPDPPQMGAGSSAPKESLASSISSAFHDKANIREAADETPSPTPSPVRQTNCRNDMMECEGGSFVSRDPSDYCRFFPCPELSISIGSKTGQDTEPMESFGTSTAEQANGQSIADSVDNAMGQHAPDKKPSLADAISASFSQVHAEGCKEDLQECEDGSFVGRDRDNDCARFPCPASTTAQANAQAAGGVTPAPDGADCAADLRRCADGGFVGQDPARQCAWFPCEDPVDDSEPGTGAAPPRCAMDLLECADGRSVGRDPDEKCRFRPCSDRPGPADPADMSAVSQHTKYSEPGGAVPSFAAHHKKKSGSNL